MWKKKRDKTYGSKKLIHIAEHVNLSKFQGLSGIMSKLLTDRDVFQPDPNLRKEYEISEEELRNFVKITFLFLKNCYL